MLKHEGRYQVRPENMGEYCRLILNSGWWTRASCRVLPFNHWILLTYFFIFLYFKLFCIYHENAWFIWKSQKVPLFWFSCWIWFSHPMKSVLDLLSRPRYHDSIELILSLNIFAHSIAAVFNPNASWSSLERNRFSRPISK